MSEDNRKIAEDEEPVEITNMFFLRVIGYGLLIATVILGIPYLIYNLNN